MQPLSSQIVGFGVAFCMCWLAHRPSSANFRLALSFHECDMKAETAPRVAGSVFL